MGFISILVMVAVFGIAFVDSLQQKQHRGRLKLFERLTPQSYQ